MAEKHPLDKSILKQYDIRGVVGETLSELDAYFIGRSYGTLVRRNYGGKTCVVGRDGRHSSEGFSGRLLEGLLDSGLDVTDIGLVSTPMLYFAVQFLGMDSGMVVTASHNPPEYNGFKMLLNSGPIWDKDIKQLGVYSASGDLERGKGSLGMRTIKQEYINFVLGILDKNVKAGLRVAWDCGNGAMASIMGDVAERLPGRHFLICDRVDGNFPNHSPDPSLEKNLRMLKNEVTSNGCDFGIGFDGDGDRIGLLDDEGFFIYGDQLLALLARDFLRDNPGEKVMSEVKASRVLYDDIASHGGIPVMWMAGHSSQKTKMKADNIRLAGETSGHIFYGENHNYDDALYASLKLINFISRDNIKLSDVRKSFPKTYSTKEIRVHTGDERKFEVVKEIITRVRQSGKSFVNVDGLRVETEDGWWLARVSNTLPEITTRCEALSEEGLELCKGELRRQLNDCGLDIDFSEDN
ncbi:MAG: phosphomannomutase/phosphoglucomutase [Rickettsiales bacterium]|jgi:phosphomannomutase|nr:phosphomannomutase/phosphoglucomutase [Rickettsiales bacterium]